MQEKHGPGNRKHKNHTAQLIRMKKARKNGRAQSKLTRMVLNPSIEQLLHGKAIRNELA